MNKWINYDCSFAIYLLNFKCENGKNAFQTMGIESLTSLMEIGLTINKKEKFEKQKTLKEDNKIRNTIGSRGIKAFLKNKVDKMKEILKIGI